MTVQTGILLLTPPLAGVAAGYAFGGRLANLTSVSLRALWLLWVAAAVQAAQFYLPAVREFLEGQAGVSMLGIMFTIVVVWMAMNISQTRPALRIAVISIFLGASLNAAVILLNGRMPFSADAARVAGLRPDIVTPKNEPAGTGTRLAFIGDVIPVPPLKTVISPGDILIILGGAGAIAAAMRRARRAGKEPGGL